MGYLAPKVHFENAKALSVNIEDRYLRYCCLELRYCIEAIVYKKLSAFDNIPKVIVDTWQPNKAVRMLTKIDEFADKNCSIELNLSNSDVPPKDGWIPLGEQKIPSVRWFAKNYNKLGNFLHLSRPKDSNSSSSDKIRRCVNEVLSEIRQYVTDGIWLRASGIELQTYLECSEDLIFNRSQVKDGDVVICDSCGFTYRVKSKGGSKYQLSYDIRDVNCHKCGEGLEISDQKLMKDREFSCNFCGQMHVIVQTYQYCAKN